jgi:hypothetical protein
VASALVALMTLVSFAPALHEGVGHDTDCEPIFVLHDAGQHRFAAPETRDALPGDDHCVACHLFRNSRTESSSASPQQTLAASEAQRLAAHAAASDCCFTPAPARAPPARA